MTFHTRITELRAWNARLAQGASVNAIARETGRDPKTVCRHIPHAGLRLRALRDERLFASCNRALAEAAR